MFSVITIKSSLIECQYESKQNWRMKNKEMEKKSSCYWNRNCSANEAISANKISFFNKYLSPYNSSI